jgi:uncharacterized protein (TIGR02145 family)
MKAILILLVISIITFIHPAIKTNNNIDSVMIGTQIWATKNLDASKFRNGDPILEAESADKWNEADNKKKPAWCYYRGDTSNGRKYGKLYNWYAVHDSRGLAPQGWHIPTDNEWTILADFLGGVNVAGKTMKSASYWDGDNSSNFSALPAGFSWGGTFSELGSRTGFWSATEKSTGNAWLWTLLSGHSSFLRGSCAESYGYSVRCVK